MKRKDKQILFAKLMYTKLIPFIYEKGYEMVEGWGFRCRECHTGKINSNHKICLAKDIELYYNGEYVNDKADAEEHFKPICEYWESLHELCRTGLDWGDANHFSLQHRGVQ